MEGRELGYRITGLTQDNSLKFLSKKELSKKPPVLEIFDEEGSTVSFELTEEFTNSLMYDIKQVYNAYVGLSYYNNKNIKFSERIKNLPSEFREHKTYFIYLILIFSLFASFYLIGKIS